MNLIKKYFNYFLESARRRFYAVENKKREYTD